MTLEIALIQFSPDVGTYFWALNKRRDLMFIVLLKFSDHKSRAGEFMEDHNKWIQQGFDDGVFLLVGSIEPGVGGTIIAHNTSMADIKSRVGDDPFVKQQIVYAEIMEISAKKVDDRLAFLVS